MWAFLETPRYLRQGSASITLGSHSVPAQQGSAADPEGVDGWTLSGRTAVVAIAIVLAACSPNPTPLQSSATPSATPSPTAPSVSSASPTSESSTTPPSIGITVTIGISLPLIGSAAAAAGSARDGALLAVKDANESAAIPGYAVTTKILDYAPAGQPDPAQGSTDIKAFVGDQSVVGVVGPFNGGVAVAQIPVSNAAGLLQCTPHRPCQG